MKRVFSELETSVAQLSALTLPCFTQGWTELVSSPFVVQKNEVLSMKAMELKVWVDGVQRIVCGVTEFTTCQEVVIALAQAIGEIARANVIILYLFC